MKKNEWDNRKGRKMGVETFSMGSLQVNG
jgi:hypothetical protein